MIAVSVGAHDAPYIALASLYYRVNVRFNERTWIDHGDILFTNKIGIRAWASHRPAVRRRNAPNQRTQLVR